MQLRMKHGSEDASLVEQACGGDAGAFDELVRHHFRRIYALLARLVGNHEDAEDLAQQCFVKAWQALSHYKEQGAFDAWLARIAVHLARDHQRARGARPGALSIAGLPSEPAESRHRGPVHEATGRETSRWMEAALQRLPHRLKAAIVLRVLEGREYSEVARITGVTENTARIHVMKARRQLLRWLEDRGTGEDS